MQINNYDNKNRIVSLAFDDNTIKDLTSRNISCIVVKESLIKLLPEQLDFNINIEFYNYINKFHNYDVFEINNDGTLNLIYTCESDDFCIFVTGKCNSNCIMCPSSDFSRKNINSISIDKLISIAKHISFDVKHITITGGEPFLIGKDIFKLLCYLKNNVDYAEYLILTNGRAFCLSEYSKLLFDNIPERTMIGIPIHGSNAEIHDVITQTKNSFKQTIIGLKKLLDFGISIEIRIVVNKININDLINISNLIITNFKSINYVSIMAMETTGSAYINRDKVWISYKESFYQVAKACDLLIKNGIDVRLYNFPLCTVEPDYWLLCEKSITDYKVRYSNKCNSCKYKDACGGVFSGTINLIEKELEPIK